MSFLRGGLRDCARHDEAVPIVHHDKERRQLDSRFASGPQASRGAGRGHRRGLDGPTMPNTLQKNRGLFPRECCLPACHAWHGEAGELVL
jgi:hypothetical protein